MWQKVKVSRKQITNFEDKNVKIYKIYSRNNYFHIEKITINKLKILKQIDKLHLLLVKTKSKYTGLKYIN